MNQPSLQRLFTGTELPDEEIEVRMIEAIDTAIGERPRMELPVGTVLFEENHRLEKLWILESGQVNLFQVIDGKEVVFHSQTVGRIIGLLAFASKHKAFFSCRAVTPIRLIELSFDELDQALHENSALLGMFVMVILRSMARRNRRAVELQTEILSLNTSLAAERDQLRRTLEELRQTQSLLVESGKMATLGQMAAGIAHELNNPVGAISRATEFLQKDLHQLSQSMPDGCVFGDVLHHALHQAPVSTREQRNARAELEKELGDADIARRVVELGLHQATDYQDLANRLTTDNPDEALNRLELFYQLGSSLRNIERCSGRITDLVKSLRNYTRTDEHLDRIDVHPGLDDTLQLMANRLYDVEVEKTYEATHRPEAVPGQLNQVWTNIIANALDAMNNRGRLILSTEDTDRGVNVRIIDSGPGISKEHLNRIFDLQFTTRKGRVDFGLGLGLAICRNIIARHGGRIDVTSESGRTEFCVFLPVTSTSSTQKEHIS